MGLCYDNMIFMMFLFLMINHGSMIGNHHRLYNHDITCLKVDDEAVYGDRPTYNWWYHIVL